MANPFFDSSSLDFNGVQGVHSPSESGADQYNFAIQGLQGFLSREKQLQLQQQQPQPPQSSYVPLDDYLASCFQRPEQQLQDVEKLANFSGTSRGLPRPPVESSLELLRNYKSKFEKLKLKQLGNSETSQTNRKRLSTGEIIMMAGTRYIQLSEQKYHDFSTTMRSFGYALQGLSEEETLDVELAHLLLAAAEKVGHEQFDSASKLLSLLEQIVYERVTPFQRVTYCFMEALRERIDKATGRFSKKEPKVNQRYEILQGLSIDVSFLVSGQKIPIIQAMQLTAIQAIIENMGSMRKLHLIDLEIRSGVQWTALMQALAQSDHRPIKHLKITAVCRSMDRDKMDGIGKGLECFAESLNLPFTFDAVHISSFSDLKEEQFETAPNESVVIFADLIGPCSQLLIAWKI